MAIRAPDEAKKVGLKWMEIMSIKGGRGPTFNGKFHFEFPFCFLEYFPNISDTYFDIANT